MTEDSSKQGAWKVLPAALVLILAWRMLGSRRFYLEHLSGYFVLWGGPAFTAQAYASLLGFLLLGLLPALLVPALGGRLADYGVGLGVPRRTARSFVICAPFVLLIGAWAARQPEFAAAYGGVPAPLGGRGVLLAGLVFIRLLFYLGWEFQFRGFLQHGLRRRVGDTWAVLIQSAASTLAHLGAPTAEVWGALAAGLFWGALAFRTRSLLSGLLQHLLLGVTLDYLLLTKAL